MGAVGAIAGIINTGLKMVDKYVEDPKRRLKARQEYIDEALKKAKEVLDEKDMAKLDSLVLDFIDHIHDL